MGKLKVIIQNFLQSSTIDKINTRINKIVPFFKSNGHLRPYSKRVANTQSSAIREILKVVGKPGFISLAGGLPDDKLFPVKLLKKAAIKTIKSNKSSGFQYSLTEGYPPLRQFIVDNFYKDTNITVDNVMITHGSQQGIDLITKIFIDPDSRISLCEPSYLGALQAYQANMSKISTVRSGELNKSDIDKLNRFNPKFLYIIPDFHNPTGERLSIETRKLLADNAKCLIVEDTAYRLLAFNGDVYPTILEFDKEEKVIQFGSFSKIIAPGFRIGWICAPEDIIKKLLAAKQFSDLHTNTFGQQVIHSYLENEDWMGHIEFLRSKYKVKRDAMIEAIEKYFPDGYTMTRPDGGMFVWVSYPDSEIDFYEVLKTAINEGVAFVPGSEFAVDNNLDNCVRLNFSYPEPEMIEKGIKRVGNLLKDLV